MNRFVTMLGAGAVAIMLSGGAWAATDSPVTPAQIASAKTPADHEAIAAAYDKEAVRLEALAKEHETMAKAYKDAATMQKGMNAPSMSAHCAKLAHQYSAAAKENRELAKQHRAMKQ